MEQFGTTGQRERLEQELWDLMGDKTRCVRVCEREVCVQREGLEEELWGDRTKCVRVCDRYACRGRGWRKSC